MSETHDNASHLGDNHGERPPVLYTVKQYADSKNITARAARLEVQRHAEQYNGAVRRVPCAGGHRILIDVATVAPELLNGRAGDAGSQRDATDAALLTEDQRRTALERREALSAFEIFQWNHRRGDKSVVRCWRKFAFLHADKYPALPSRFATVRRWQKAYREVGLFGLTDRRGRPPEEPHPRVADYLKSLYLLPSRPTVAGVYRHVSPFAKAEGLACPGLRWWQKEISEGRLIPYSVAVLFREGDTAYEAKCCPPLEQDNESVPAGDMWVVDHHLLDVFVTDHKGKARRPWLTEIMDIGSRMVVGAELSFSPNADILAGVFADASAEYGAPLTCKWDNGKDMTSRKLMGETVAERKARERFLRDHPDQEKIELSRAQVGIVKTIVKRNIFAIAYNAKAKLIERHFGTLEAEFNKFVPSYCGSNPDQKPEHLAALIKADKCPAFEDYREQLLDWLFNTYNTQPHSGVDGLSPEEAMQQRRTGPKRVVSEVVLSLLRDLIPVPRTVSKRGVQVGGIWYGGFDGTLRGMMKQQVLVGIPRSNAERAHIFTLDRRFVCAVKANDRFNPALSGEDVREAIREQRRIRRAEKNWGGMSVKRNLRVAELARLEQLERGRERGEQLRKAAGAEETMHMITGWEQAGADVAAAEARESIRVAAGGIDTSTESEPVYSDDELIDLADFGDEESGPGADFGYGETDESEDAYRDLVANDE